MANRRRLDERLANAFDQGLVDGSPFAFVLVDVNYFKLHNDTYAHLACDKALVEVGTRSAAALGK